MLDDFDSIPQQPARQTRRRTRRALAVVAALFLVLIAGVGGFALYLNHIVSSQVTREPGMLPGETSPSPGSLAGKAGKALSTKGTNILAIGSDARPGDTFSRSDVIILAHIPDDNSAVYLIHFPRDLYVDIPGHGKDKINAAYAFGGPSLLVSTVQNLVGVKIDHVAKTDFEGFKRMTDAVGGVRVYAKESSDEGGFVVTKGWNDLNGAQALIFVRERHQLSQGDISRGERQQAFIKALMLKTLSADVLFNPLKLAHFVDAATSNLIVDEQFDVSEMRSLAFDLKGLRSGDIKFITAPFSGFGTSPAGASIDILDEAGMTNLGDHLQNETMDTYSDATVAP